MAAEVTKRLGLADFVERVWADAPRRDTERILLTDLREELRSLRVGALRVPRDDGSRLPLTDFFQVILDLAAADSNLAHALRNHFNSVENNVLSPAAHSPRALEQAAQGALFFGAAQEATASSGSLGKAASRFEPQPDGTYRLTTRKFYATGSLYADYLSVGAELGEGSRWALVEATREGISLPDDWGGFGQRLTGSGSIVFDNVRITDEDFIDRPGWAKQEAERYPFTFNQVYLTTTVAGIAQRALADAIDLVQARSRNYYHGTSEKVEDEVVVQAAIGVASAKAFAAATIVAESARLLEVSFEHPDDLEASLTATLAATRAKITVEELTLDVIEQLTRVSSGSTLSTERALDRHWRNVKTLASHNPTIYKHRILGEYELLGTRPPVGAYF